MVADLVIGLKARDVKAQGAARSAEPWVISHENFVRPVRTAQKLWVCFGLTGLDLIYTFTRAAARPTRSSPGYHMADLQS